MNTVEKRKYRIDDIIDSYTVVHVRHRGELVKYILIETTSDIFKYMKDFGSVGADALWKVIRSRNMDEYRIENSMGKPITLDHYIAQLHLYGCKGVIEAFSDLNTKRFESMYKIFRSHGALLVNKAGGFQPLKGNVVEGEEYQIFRHAFL
jgi:hypothetical protein